MRRIAAEFYVAQFSSVVRSPFPMRPRPHDESVIVLRFLFNGAIQAPRTITVLGIEQSAHNECGGTGRNLIDEVSGIASLPPRIVIGMLIELFPKSNTVAHEQGQLG